MTLLTTLNTSGTDTPEWMPTPTMLAAILRAYTRGPASRDATIAGEQNAFTATTRPTYAQVVEIIQIAVDEMSGMVESRQPCSAALSRAFRAAALYRAAMLVCVSYLPEQTKGEDTAFSALESMWKTSSVSAAKAINENCPAPGSEDTGTVEGMPLGRVPYGRPMTTWHERF